MNQPYTLRVCTPEDADALSLLGGATFLQSYADVLEGHDIVAHCRKHHAPEVYAKYLSDPSSRCYVAETEPTKSPIGYITLCRPDLPLDDIGPSDWELKRFYLLHRFQGQGIGRALMDQAVETTRETGRERLLLGVYGQNHAALRFYTAAGFRQLGERFFTVGSQTHHDFVLGREV